MRKVDVISSRVVGRASNESKASSISRLELNPWDLPLLPIVPIQRGLLYHHKPQSQSFIHHLQNSLSRTLDLFPPLAGRLASTRHDDGTATFFVDCNNAGAEFTHAVAAAVSVSDIIEAKYVPTEIVFSFFPLDKITNLEGISKPLLAVQVTELADGLFIGCAANHAVVDGTSFWHFLNSWSEISRGLNTISKTPIFHRSIIPTKVVGDIKHLPPLDQNHQLLRKVFHLSKESLRKLKAKANSEVGTEKISSYQALSALLWRATTRCQQPKNNHNPSNREVNFTLIVGARSRVGLGDGYFGNAIYTCATWATERELLQNGIGHAALKINELVNRQTSEAAIKSFQDHSENRGFIGKWPSLFIIGSPRHDVYGNDFGWGKPIAARSGRGRDSDGKITIFPAAESGGVDLEVSLVTEKMMAMENDPDFIAALALYN